MSRKVGYGYGQDNSMRQVSNITIATMKDPEGAGWLAQVHIEYKGTNHRDVLPLKGDAVMPLLDRCTKALDKRLHIVNGTAYMKR